MATALSWRDKLQKLEEELECSLCLERLQDPRVFPQCQHSFCYECIEQLSQGKSKIFCPECRAEVEVNNNVIYRQQKCDLNSVQMSQHLF